MNHDRQSHRRQFLPSPRSQVEPFRAMEIVARAAELERGGKDVISLCLGQPSSPAPDSARRAAMRAIEGGRIGYTPSPGLASLRDRIAAYYSEHYDVRTEPARIFITSGSSAGFVLAFLAAFQPGDRIAIPSPGYPAYRNILRALSLTPVEIQTKAQDRWVLTENSLREAHAQKPLDGLLVANPNNPNGTMARPEAFRALASCARTLGIRFISDEIYHGLTFGMPETTALDLDPDAFVINSFSKFFCMTGWRIGWMIVPESMISTIDRLQQNAYICAAEISQVAAEAAFEDIEQMNRLRDGYDANRRLMLDRLPELGFGEVQPIDGAFYAYCDSSPLASDSTRFASALLEQCGVAITPGKDFDTERGGNWVRLSFCGDQARLLQAFERIGEWLAKKRR